MLVVIDRFEEDFAVVEIGEQRYNVPRALFEGAEEGDTVEIIVRGKVPPEGEDPHAIFERLRKKSRKRKKPPIQPDDDQQ